MPRPVSGGGLRLQRLASTLRQDRPVRSCNPYKTHLRFASLVGGRAVAPHMEAACHEPALKRLFRARVITFLVGVRKRMSPCDRTGLSQIRDVHSKMGPSPTRSALRVRRRTNFITPLDLVAPCSRKSHMKRAFSLGHGGLRMNSKKAMSYQLNWLPSRPGGDSGAEPFQRPSKTPSRNAPSHKSRIRRQSA